MSSAVLREVPYNAWATSHILSGRARPDATRNDGGSGYRAVFEHAFQFIGLLTPDGILLDANRRALEFAGLTRADVVGRPFWDAPWWARAVAPAAVERLKAAIAKAAAGAFVRYDVDIRGIDGSVATFDFSLTPVVDDRRRVALPIPEGRDITAIAERGRARDGVLTGVLHDLTSPLTAIKGWADLAYAQVIGGATPERRGWHGSSRALPRPRGPWWP